MSRLRRLLLNHRVFFVTTNFAPSALPVASSERDIVLEATGRVRLERGFLLFAYVVMPTHCHLLFSPADEDTLSNVLRDMKLRAAKRILAGRGNRGPFWQARSFDRIMRHRKEFVGTVDYIHENPVADGLTDEPSKWRWSSWFGWNPGGVALIPVDEAYLPLDEHAPVAW